MPHSPLRFNTFLSLYLSRFSFHFKCLFLLQEEHTGEIVFYLKGADVVMSGIVQYNDWLEEECGNMAREGLRTLVVAKKTLTEEQYVDFEVSLIITRNIIERKAF